MLRRSGVVLSGLLLLPLAAAEKLRLEPEERR